MTTLPALLRPPSTEIQLPREPFRVIAIDLGTTNSTVAEIAWDPDEGLAGPARCLAVKQETTGGDYFNVLVPSVVAIYGGKVWIGEGAKRLRARAPELNLKQNKNLFFECKNEIGSRRTYHRAPESFRSAAEIGSKVLRFLYEAALNDNDLPLKRSPVITVPASFQIAQRKDTIKAAELSGISIQGGDLLDEPVAAFLDYLFQYGADLVPDLEEPKRLVVFDFGGGTCDVAVFRLRSVRGGPLQTESLAVSRYHRLGGGDIDKAIIYEVLIPQLCAQNDISQYDLGYEDKKIYIEPAYLGVAEALKISLCTEISRLIKFNQYDDRNKEEISVKLPGVYSCQVKGRSLSLKAPKLTAAEFEDLLEPFLDQDMLFARETDYRLTQSIFAPLTDALDRSGLNRKDIDWCLLIGGSSFIPQVIRAVKEFMPQARLLTYQDRESMQTAVARGAAYHALSLALFGKGLVQPVCHDRIFILTTSGPVELIPKGVPLPYPTREGYASNNALVVPKKSIFEEIKLRVEIVAGEGTDERLLLRSSWRIPPGVEMGAPLRLDYCFDENQILRLTIRLANAEQVAPFDAILENPLTNVVNPGVDKLEIEELEEQLRTGQIPKDRVVDTIVFLAEKYAKLGQREKALEYLGRALRARNRPDAAILNQMAIYYGELGDHQREEKYYREAAQASSWGGSWFNLALALKRQGRLQEAAEAVVKAIQRDRQPPYLVLRALIAEGLKNQSERNLYLEEALSSFGPYSTLSDWELGWLLTALNMAGDQEKAAQVKNEQQKRRRTGIDVPPEGELPLIKPGLQKV